VPVRIVGSERVFSGRLISLDLVRLETPRGEAVREVVRHPGAVVLIPFDGSRVYLVRQFRPSVSSRLLELPAGTLEPGESPEDCAARELEEETGLRASELRRLFSAYPTPGYCDEVLHFFLATGLERGEARPEEDEEIEVVALPPDEAVEEVFSSEALDMKTALGLLWLRANLDLLLDRRAPP